MNEATKHPEWAAVGATVHIVRRSPTGRLDHHRTEVVVRHTATQIVTESADGSSDPCRFKRTRFGYVEVPRYSDYTTTIQPGAPDA